MAEQPGTEGRGNNGGILGFSSDAEGLMCPEVWLDVLQKGVGKGVAGVEVGKVDVEAVFGVLVGEEACIREFPAEDYCASSL